MINRTHILPKEVSLKRIGSFVKKILASNIALALISIPTPSIAIAQPQSNLIIPENTLNTAFNVTTQKDEVKVQVPVNFIYMSQGFTAFHPGIDLATHYGYPIKSILPGIVEFAGYSPFGYGNEVLIDNGNGMESLYAHLSKIEVKTGDSIDEHSQIGLVGTTGHATGPHLHLEIHINGRSVNPLSVLPSIKDAQTLTFDDSDKNIPTDKDVQNSKEDNSKEVIQTKTDVLSQLNINGPTNNLISKLPTSLTSIPQ